MKPAIRSAFEREMNSARSSYGLAALDVAFHHLERAHILGQRYLGPHMLTHWWMLKVGVRQKSMAEVRGQVFRMFAVIPGFLFGWVPVGNTGGSNVFPLKRMPLPTEFDEILSGPSVARDVARRMGIMVAVLGIAAIATALTADYERAREARELNTEWEKTRVDLVEPFGSTATLEIVPLVNWFGDPERFKTEPGVSYLVRTDHDTVLFDTGFNRNNESPSPVQHNMAQLGIEISDIDAVFISHAHRDHVGGIAYEEAKTFSLGREQVDLSGKLIFAPVPMTYPDMEITIIEEPRAILDAVASTGPIPRRLLVGRIDEQALVVNVEGSGLVVVVGCGHQTVPKLIDRVQAAFSEPIYAIVGDVHYPVPEGRLKIVGIDVQRSLASGEGLFEPIDQQVVDEEMHLLDQTVEKLALGGHDTSDAVLKAFGEQFGARFQHIEIGVPVRFGRRDQ